MSRIYLPCVLCLFLVVGCREIPQPSGGWQEVESPTDKDLCSVFALSKDNAWAVGDSGVIIHWDGETWSLVESPTSERLNSVYFVSPDDGWAVGNSGTILHYDGNNWHKVESPTSEILCSVYFLSPYEGWAVGSGGIILHYYNGKWHEAESLTSAILFDCYFLSPHNGWAVGGDLEPGPVVLHYNGVQWKVIADSATLGFSGGYLGSVYFTSPTEGWVIGGLCTFHPNSRILKYDGKTWNEEAHLSSTRLWSLHFSSSINGYAVGDSKMLHYDGSEWHDVELDLDRAGLRSVYLLSKNEGWAVGSKIFHLTQEGREK